MVIGLETLMHPDAINTSVRIPTRRLSNSGLTQLARGGPGCSRAQPQPIVVDCGFPSGLALQLLRFNVSHLQQSYHSGSPVSTAEQTRWEEYHTGTLYLSAFSGPVEGILLICVIYLVTAIHPSGPSFWDTPIVSLVPGNYGVQAAQAVDKILCGYGVRYKLEYLGVNVAFMIFGAFGTVGNIVNRYATRRPSSVWRGS